MARKLNKNLSLRSKLVRYLKLVILSINIGLGVIILLLIIGSVFKLPWISSTISAYKQLKNYQPATLRYKTLTVEISPDIKNFISEKALTELAEINYNGTKRFNFVEQASHDSPYDLNLTLAREDKQSIGYLDFIPVGHFYWIRDNLITEKVKKIYTLDKYKTAAELLFPNKKIDVCNNIKDLEKTLSKTDENYTVGLISPLELTPRLKLLSIKNYYYLDAPEDNPLRIYVNCKSKDQAACEFATRLFKKRKLLKTTSLEKERILTLNMTGVTAITRGLALKIEQTKQYDWPAKKIANFLKSADLTHTSNEVSFVPGCTPSQGMRFCSNPKYVKSLEAIGLDIIELTGNHNNDYGAEWSTWSIKNVYNPHKWDYFGGGLNSEDASKILFKQLKNTKLAFLGYNYYDTMLNSVALASSNRSGANSFSFSKLKNDINKAKKQGAIVIVDFQFTECYAYPTNYGIYPPCYAPIPNQREIFRKAIDYGADIVIGTQAHQPQTYEIYKNKLIFYGLGNLFFDQWQWPGTRQALILTHYFYNGKHIQTKITTIEYDRNLQPYITTGEKRTTLLKYLKRAR